MFRSANSEYAIRIKYAQLITGKFDWIDGEYRPVQWGNDQNMLKIAFESGNDANYFRVADEHQDGYQHTVSHNQRHFFFPLGNAPLNQLRINGFIATPNPGTILAPHMEIVGRSRPIKEAILITQKVINCTGEKTALAALERNLITLEEVVSLNKEQLKIILTSRGIPVRALPEQTIFNNGYQSSTPAHFEHHHLYRHNNHRM